MSFCLRNGMETSQCPSPCITASFSPCSCYQSTITGRILLTNSLYSNAPAGCTGLNCCWGFNSVFRKTLKVLFNIRCNCATGPGALFSLDLTGRIPSVQQRCLVKLQSHLSGGRKCPVLILNSSFLKKTILLSGEMNGGAECRYVISQGSL